jgi:hypothetical protein
MTLANIAELKTQAKRLRTALAENGQSLSHAQALELVSKQHGFRDWNTACASARNSSPRSFKVGDRVTGTYMQQAFAGEIRGLSKVGQNDHIRVDVQFDQPVDVVTFDSFSSYRSRVNCVIDEDGIAVKKTSNGEPYLKIKIATADPKHR